MHRRTAGLRRGPPPASDAARRQRHRVLGARGAPAQPGGTPGERRGNRGKTVGKPGDTMGENSMGKNMEKPWEPWGKNMGKPEQGTTEEKTLVFVSILLHEKPVGSKTPGKKSSLGVLCSAVHGDDLKIWIV